MHLIPMFYGMVFFGSDMLNPAYRRYTLIAFIPLVFILIFSIQQASLEKTAYGNSQQVPVEYFAYIKDHASVKPFPPVVSSYQARRQVWAFQNYRSGSSLNPLTASDFPNPSADFLIHEYPLPDSLKSIFKSVLTNQSTQTGLYRNIIPQIVISSDTSVLENPVIGQNEYYELFNLSSDTLFGKNIRLETELTLESPVKPLQAAVVVELFDRNRKSLAYEAIDLDLLQPAWNQQHHVFRHVLLIHDIPLGSETILLYFWNKKKAPVRILAGRATIKITKGI